MAFSRTRLLHDYTRPRLRMVEEQLIKRGISDQLVLKAMREVPRHLFVPESLAMSAYTDYYLPIGYGQTISQPLVVAYMTQKLHVAPQCKVLEIGTGSGYQAAILAAMGAEVYTIERIQELQNNARDIFKALGLNNIHTREADGTLGWQLYAPYDRIIVTAGAPKIPKPLLEQLADPGIMIIPVGPNRREQRFVRVVKNEGRFTAQILDGDKGNVAFVDLVGDYGWQLENEQ